MDKKFIINVNELKTKMNPIFKIVFILPFEIVIYIFNYIYIAILTSYFKINIQPEIIIDSVNFKTDINIEYTKNYEIIDLDNINNLSDSDTDQE
jgi:hypothetical protein